MRRPDVTRRGEAGVAQRVRDAVAHLRTWTRGERRAPHKPLLVLYALGRVQRGDPRLVEFADAEPALNRLLDRFGPSGKTTHPLYPFWYLRSDGIWEVPRSDRLPRRAGNKEPRVSAVRDQHIEGGFPPEVYELLRARPELVVDLARNILDEHFAESLHEDIAESVGLDLSATAFVRQRPRLPGFRDNVLRAYGHRCAICGLQALLDGTAIGVEAAHVRWHAFDGPSTLSNGLALCVLHHKFFDLGVLGLSAQRTVLVTTRVSGDSELAQLVIRHVGQPLALPQSGCDVVDARHIRWHNEQVFKQPARIAG